MSIPTKSTCHSCNGTGIDPTVGFLDCEFCTPAYAGVSLSAPEQPEPKFATCNDHGEIGCLRPDGYDSERCPDCNPLMVTSEVKRYHVGDTGLVEGLALGRISVVLLADFERVKAERDALQQRLNVTDQQNDELANKMQCQFPQSCTTRCDCDIPDFSPGNGNKARRRAELLGQIKSVQPLAKCVDPFAVCLECFGAGTICTGIEEASSTICNKCDGTGTEKK